MTVSPSVSPTASSRTEIEYPPAASIEPLTVDALERILGCHVSTFPGRYVEAFTHRSAAYELRVPSLERLEFLGDAVISFVIAKYLFDSYPNEDEGFLTRLRTRLTCSATLASFARLLDLGKYIVLDGKGIVYKSYEKDAVLEDAFEALVGAVYLDRGLVVARDFLVSLVERYVDKDDLLKNNNWKDILVKYCQSKQLPLPAFISERMPALRGGGMMYNTTVTVCGVTGRGVDTMKKKSEMKAAHVVLLQLGVLTS